MTGVDYKEYLKTVAPKRQSKKGGAKEMTEKVFGVTRNLLECQLAKYEADSIIEDSVPVVSLEWLEKECKKEIYGEELFERARKEAEKK